MFSVKPAKRNIPNVKFVIKMVNARNLSNVKMVTIDQIF